MEIPWTVDEGRTTPRVARSEPRRRWVTPLVVAVLLFIVAIIVMRRSEPSQQRALSDEGSVEDRGA